MLETQLRDLFRVVILPLSSSWNQMFEFHHPTDASPYGFFWNLSLNLSGTWVSKLASVLENTACNIGLKVQSLQSARRKVDY